MDDNNAPDLLHFITFIHSNSQQKKVSHSLQKLSGGIIDA